MTIPDHMQMVGLRQSVYWLSWFIVYFGVIFLITLIGAFIAYRFIFKTEINFMVLYILLLGYGLSLLTFCFAMSTMFTNARTAATVGLFATAVPSFFYYLPLFLGEIPGYANWLLGLISPFAFTSGMRSLVDQYFLEDDLDVWDDSAGFPIAGAMIMLLLDVILYGLIALWLDQILPTEYGIQRHPLFCLQPDFWKGNRSGSMSRSENNEEFEGPNIEKIPNNMKGTETIIVSNIKKTFKECSKPPVHAVRGLSMKIYPNEITAILGHNGAGKSTLFNMLTGMTSPTSGTANIRGYDITDHNQMEQLRKTTGICPQHNVLIDELTTKEHLEFFARIRGMSKSSIANAVDELIHDVDLVEKADTRSKKLSGGQKRKLSVAIALIGDPKVIFLDEPTAGVDPYSRRRIWSLLKQKKEGKTILLTTHFMDEADLLGDRKAIISHGALRCYGSSLFLKSRFGQGYHLTMVLKQEAQLSQIDELVSENVPDAEKARLHGKELSYILPFDKVHAFPKLFGSIEDDIKGNGPLGIDSYGTTMGKYYSCILFANYVIQEHSIKHFSTNFKNMILFYV